MFNALRYTPFEQVRVVIIGQDPYHGLAFSVQAGVAAPPSLKNIFKELHEDVQFQVPNHGCLIPWAKQGVLLLNAVLKAPHPSFFGCRHFSKANAVLQAAGQAPFDQFHLVKFSQPAVAGRRQIRRR